MSRSTLLRSTSRVATATATAALAGLLVAAPASARPDPGTGGRDLAPSERTGSGITRVVPQPGPLVDDGSEYLQVGAGLLAGVALAGAGAALVSRRHHRLAHPA